MDVTRRSRVRSPLGAFFELFVTTEKMVYSHIHTILFNIVSILMANKVLFKARVDTLSHLNKIIIYII